MADVGQFIIAYAPFKQDHSQGKIRPCLVLAVAMHGEHKVLLCAPESTQTHKVHSPYEVMLSGEELQKVGLYKDCVIRFARTDLVAIMDRDVRNTLGRVADLSHGLQVSIRNAAKSVGCAV